MSSHLNLFPGIILKFKTMKRLLVFVLIFIVCGGESESTNTPVTTEKEITTATEVEKQELQETESDSEIISVLKIASEEAKK